MKEKVVEWIEKEFEFTNRVNGDMRLCMSRCYGALMFTLSQTGDDESLGDWWDDVMHPLFDYAIEMEHAPKYVNNSGVGAT